MPGIDSQYTTPTRVERAPKKPAAPKTRVRAATAVGSPDAVDRNRAARAVAGPPAPKTRVRVVPSGDQVDRNRAARAEQLAHSVPATPDQADRQRSPAQRAHDAEIVKRNVRDSRAQVLRDRGSGSVTRAVGHLLSGAADVVTGGATDDTPARAKRPAGGGTGFAMIDAQRGAKRMPGIAFGLGSSALSDAGELAVTTPTSIAKFVATAATHPKKVPGMLAAPYIELAKHPGREIMQRPVSTALMVAPAVRIPGRAAGRAARLTGKQTLDRPAATLPGTALREQRTGSRDLLWRAHQSRKDKKAPAPTMSAHDVQRRVDEHFDYARQHEARAEASADRAARQATKVTYKGRPRAERKQAADEAAAQAREAAREQARLEMDAQFAREFGANARPSTGRDVELAARAEREAALARGTQARTRVRETRAAHDSALADARQARARVKKSPTLAALETRRRDAQRDLAHAQRSHADAMAEFGVARGRAQVLSHNIAGIAGERRAQARTVPAGTTQFAAGGRGVQIAANELAARTQRVRDTRNTIQQLDQQIAAERQRISGVPPAEHQQLIRAIEDRAAASTELAAARAETAATRAQHVTVKKAASSASLVDPAAEGRLFTHKADAAKVAQRLNEPATEIRRGSHAPARYVVQEDGTVKLQRTPGGARQPLEFTVRETGDQYAVVPKVAQHQLVKHQEVGSSMATPAKVMRRSRGQFTQAVLPLSLKWLAGQGVEAGVRSIVAGAGPFDLLRIKRVVGELNKQRPGAGDELLMRISGGQFELTGAARDFARGKSLAAEFQDTKLEQLVSPLTHAANTAPMRAVRKGWHRYTDTVIGAVNGLFEHTAREAMAGQALKNSPLMQRRITSLSDRAIQDAAQGLHGTDAQVELARTVDRMYGQYQKFSPERRSLLLHWSPFLPWYLNVATFLGKVLPVDHPIQAALLADTSTATEEWRKTAHLSLRYGNGDARDFLLGRYPGKGGRLFPVSKYTPFGIGSDVGGSVAGLMLPQFMGPIKNAAGVDWKWKRLKHPGYAGKEFNLSERTIRALVTAAESQVPGVAQAGRISGLTPRLVDKKADIPPFRERLSRELPWTPAAPGAARPGSTATISTTSAAPKPRPVRVRPVAPSGVHPTLTKVKPVQPR